MYPRITPTTWSALSPRVTNPHSHRICGAPAIDCAGERLDARLRGRQGRLLFTCLAVNRHRQVPRDELAEALWREPDPAAIDVRLNRLLYKLRRVLGADTPDGRSTPRLCPPSRVPGPSRPRRDD